MSHTVRLKFKAQMGLGILCCTLTPPLDLCPALEDESRTLRYKLFEKPDGQILGG